MPQMRATPQQPVLGGLSRFIRGARDVGDVVQIPIFGGLGSLAFGELPEEVERWSYGDYPMMMPLVSGTTRLPVLKRGREGALVDTMFAAPMAKIPARAVRVAPGVVREAAEDFARASAQAAPRIVRETGGQTVSQMVDRPVSAARGVLFDLSPPGPGGPDLEPMRNWLETTFRKYIARDAGSPTDVLRRLADEGVFRAPADADASKAVQEAAARNRTLADMSVRTPTPTSPGVTMATTPEGARYEDIVDSFMAPRLAGGLLNLPEIARRNPWLQKVPPETPVMYPNYGSGDFIELSGIKDFLLRNMYDATTDPTLPPELRLRPEQLNNISMEAAVRHADALDQWRNRATVEKMLQNPALKPYSERAGDYQWFEFSPEGGEDALRKAMREESDIMGHCLGNPDQPYCRNILEGQGRALTLRNMKTGQPHVTVELRPPMPFYMDPDFLADPTIAKMWPQYVGSPSYRSKSQDPEMKAFGEWMQRLHPESYEKYASRLNPSASDPWSIKQIKGKGNAAPVARYQPYVQQLIRSGDWKEVKDLNNAGMINLDPASDLANAMRAAGQEVPRFITMDEFSELLKQFPARYARGGQVNYDPARIQGIIEGLRAEVANGRD